MGQSSCRETAGFTMLEALVAIVVLAIGVLGVANLLIKSFRFSQQASYDTLALQLASDMADRMRANNAQMLASNSGYFFDTSTGAPAVPTGANFFTTPCASGSTVCAANMVTFDLAEWTRRVQTALPGGRAVICRDSSIYSNAAGYTWACNATAGGTGQASDSPIVIKMGWVSRFTDKPGVDVATGTAMPDTQAANGSATPQIVIVANPGVSN
ncbi:type IV pilus modification protein PilV [Cupriavidus basilensis]|nr:type IV pilus modification protein PilV [Cupriavidus basilensis]